MVSQHGVPTLLDGYHQLHRQELHICWCGVLGVFRRSRNGGQLFLGYDCLGLFI